MRKNCKKKTLPMSEESTPSSSSSRELDDELMLRLYTGKMDQEKWKDEEEPDSTTKSQSNKRKREVAASDSGDYSVNGFPRKKQRAESLPTTPSRYYGATVMCFSCRKQGHTSRQCTEDVKNRCILCSLPEHLGECPNRLCPRCNNPGHEQYECTLPKATASCFVCDGVHDPQRCSILLGYSSKEAYCFNCGGQGHIGQVCQRPTISELVSLPASKVFRLLDLPEPPRGRRNGSSKRRLSAPLPRTRMKERRWKEERGRERSSDRYSRRELYRKEKSEKNKRKSMLA